MRFPLTLKASATPGPVEDTVAMSPEFQAQANSRDQEERPAVTGVSREVAVCIDISQAQTPGKILSPDGLSCDLEGEPAAISPRHPAIGSVFPHLASGLLHARIVCHTGEPE